MTLVNNENDLLATMKPLLSHPELVKIFIKVLDSEIDGLQDKLHKTAVSALADTTGSVRNSGLVLYGSAAVLIELRDVMKRLIV